jgi:hypothetical protein
MGVRLPVAVRFCQAEIDDVNGIGPLAQAHQKVVGLDVAVDEGAGVDELEAGDLV